MTKVISISDDAYLFLKESKEEGESFSNVILRFAAEKKIPIINFFGKWPITKREASNIKIELSNDRKNFKTREIKL